MRETKYLLRKKSGSRSHYKTHWLDYNRADYKGDFSDEDVESRFPKTEGMITKNKNGIDLTLVKRWLFSQVGKNFDIIYAEFLTRVQPKYLETHRDSIYCYVKKPHEIVIKDNKIYTISYQGKLSEMKRGFYIHPNTNLLFYKSYGKH
jgi:hypothetical protein